MEIILSRGSIHPGISGSRVYHISRRRHIFVSSCNNSLSNATCLLLWISQIMTSSSYRRTKLLWSSLLVSRGSRRLSSCSGRILFIFLSFTVHSSEFFLSILLNEIFNYNVAATNSDNKSTILNFSKDFLCTKQIISVFKFFDGHRASILVNSISK